MSSAMPWSRLVARQDSTPAITVAKPFAQHLADAEALTRGLRAKWPVPDDPRDDESCQNAAIWLAVATYAAERLGADAQQTYIWMLDDGPATLTQVLSRVSGPEPSGLQKAWHRLLDNPGPAIHLSNLMARGFYHYQHPEVGAESMAAHPMRWNISRFFRR